MSDLGDDPDRIKASITSYRSHYKRQKGVVKAVCDSLEAHPSALCVKELEEKYAAINATVDKLVDRYMKLNELEPDNKEWDVRIAEYMDDATILGKGVKKRIADAATPAAPDPSHAPAAGGAAHGPHANKGPRIIDALKPKTLSQEATPAELRAWKNQFKDYFTSSEMDKFPVHVQRGFFTSCLDKHLTARVTQWFTPGTEVFTTPTNRDTCMGILDEDFERRYPLFARRLQFFQYSQSGGQTYSDYVSELQKLGEEADLHSLKVDKIYVFRIIAGVTEEKLRDRFFKLTDPSLKDIMREGSAHEAAKNILKVLKGTTQSVYATVHNTKAQTYPKGRYRGKGQQKGSRTQGMQQDQTRKFDGLCWKCGSADHRANKCKKEVYCDHCKSDRHSPNYCYKKEGLKLSNSRSQARSSPSTFQRTNALTGRISSKSKPTPRMLTKFKSVPGTPNGYQVEFEFKSLPDTGATRSIIAYDVVKRHAIEFERHDQEKMYAANGTGIRIIGNVKLLASVEGNKEVEIEAKVSPTIKNDVFISWHDMINLGVIPESFPNVDTGSAGALSQPPDHLAHDTLRTIVEESDNLSDKGKRLMKDSPKQSHIRGDKRMCGNLPTISKKATDQSEARGARQRTRDKNNRFDKLARPLSNISKPPPRERSRGQLVPGDKVWVWSPSTRKWYAKGTVLGSRSLRNSYVIRTEDGSVFSRNGHFLCPAKELVQVQVKETPQTPRSILHRSPRLPGRKKKTVKFK